MTLRELSSTLLVPLKLTDTQVGLSFVNNSEVWQYPYNQNDFTDSSQVKAYLMDCDLTGSAMASDTATLFVKYGGTTYNDTITISIADDDSIVSAIDALIAAP